MSTFKLSKKDRLSSRKAIGELFTDGQSLFVFPIKVVYKPLTFEDGKVVKAAFSVSKRSFKRAVKRNHLKRLMRESYRLNKAALITDLEQAGTQMGIMFIYAAKEERDYATVEKGMLKCLEKLRKVASSSREASE